MPDQSESNIQLALAVIECGTKAQDELVSLARSLVKIELENRIKSANNVKANLSK